MTEKQEIKNLRKYLKSLIKNNREAILILDKVMKDKESYERGQRVAKIINALEFATDASERYGLNKPPK